jgi:hypothetical protein
MLAISRKLQRSGYSVAYTKHGDHELGVPDPPAGAAWIQFIEDKDCQGMERALGKLGLVESVRKRGRACYELPEERGAACVVEAGDGTGYLYLSELGPVEEARASKLGSLLENIRGGVKPELEETYTHYDAKKQPEIAAAHKAIAKARMEVGALNAYLVALDEDTGGNFGSAWSSLSPKLQKRFLGIIEAIEGAGPRAKGRALADILKVGARRAGVPAITLQKK